MQAILFARALRAKPPTRESAACSVEPFSSPRPPMNCRADRFRTHSAHRIDEFREGSKQSLNPNCRAPAPVSAGRVQRTRSDGRALICWARSAAACRQGGRAYCGSSRQTAVQQAACPPSRSGTPRAPPCSALASRALQGAGTQARTHTRRAASGARTAGPGQAHNKARAAARASDAPRLRPARLPPSGVLVLCSRSLRAGQSPPGIPGCGRARGAHARPRARARRDTRPQTALPPAHTLRVPRPAGPVPPTVA